MSYTFNQTVEVGCYAVCCGVYLGVNPVEASDHDRNELGGAFLVKHRIGTVELRSTLATVRPTLVQKHDHHFAVGRVRNDRLSEVSAGRHLRTYKN